MGYRYVYYLISDPCELDIKASRFIRSWGFIHYVNICSFTFELLPHAFSSFVIVFGAATFFFFF